MNKDEALKMAIEALEFIKDGGFYTGHDDCINACKEALEQSTVAELNNEYLRDTNVIGLEQPAQEPVAWIEVIDHHGHKTSKVNLFDKGLQLADGTNLYTHPHQWQGLTDDEIDALEHNDFTCWGRDDLIVFGRAIEQALKEKNT